MNATKQIRPVLAKDRLRTRLIRAVMVDDSPFMLVLLSRLLAKNKRIMLVGSTTEGPRAFQFASMSHPDLVFMDLHMLGADGAEITRWLKQLQNPPIVFVLTSDESAYARARCLAAGADAFLVKSPDLEIQLQAAIQKLFSDDFEEPKISY